MAFDNDQDGTPMGTAQSGPFSDRIFGMFADRDGAVEAIRALKFAGFEERSIGVAMKDRGDQKDLTEETGSDAARGAATGAVSGGLVGGIVGLLGSLLIPGIGPIVAGGVLASTLTGAGIGAASGGLIGGLIGAGASEEQATHFDTGFRAGGVLVTVDAGDLRQQAVTILQAHGADLGPSTAGREPAGRAFSERPRSGVDDLEFENEAGPRRGWGDGYDGDERRNRHDGAYSGPERRLAGV